MQPQRRSIRLRGYDYTQPGAYFVTVCCAGRRSLLAELLKDSVALKPAGEIVSGCWSEIPDHFPRVELDTWVVMPNHIHGILILTERCRGTPWRAPTAFHGEAFGQPKPDSLSSIVRLFKSASTRRIRGLGLVEGRIWQRGYYERVVRGEVDLLRIRRYIEENPARWARDPENPIASGG